MNVARAQRTGVQRTLSMGGTADSHLDLARQDRSASGAPLDTVEAAGYRAIGGRGSGGRCAPASLHPTSKGDGNVEDGGRVTGALPSPTPYRGGPVAWEWPVEKGRRGNRTRSIRSAEMRSTREAAERLLVVAYLMRVMP